LQHLEPRFDLIPWPVVQVVDSFDFEIVPFDLGNEFREPERPRMLREQYATGSHEYAMDLPETAIAVSGFQIPAIDAVGRNHEIHPTGGNRQRQRARRGETNWLIA